MESKEFYIKYLGNQPVGIKTHILITTTGIWVQSLNTVGDLIVAFQALANSPLANAFVGDINLHLPDGFDRSALSEDCFASDDGSLDPGCLLSALGSLGSKSKQPLIIKSKNNSDQGTFYHLLV